MSEEDPLRNLRGGGGRGGGIGGRGGPGGIDSNDDTENASRFSFFKILLLVILAGGILYLFFLAAQHYLKMFKAWIRVDFLGYLSWSLARI